jgi:hypothetical protein
MKEISRLDLGWAGLMDPLLGVILIRADGTARIAGDLHKALALVVAKRDRESVFRWSGEGGSHEVHAPFASGWKVSLAS